MSERTPPHTGAEARAFNAGVVHVLDYARRIADRIEGRSVRPLADGFATEALRALADEAPNLMMPIPDVIKSRHPTEELSGDKNPA